MPNYKLIREVDASGVNEVSVTSIPQNFTDLIIRGVLRSNAQTTYGNWTLKVNSSSTATDYYYWYYTYDVGISTTPITTSAGSSAGYPGGKHPGTGASADEYGYFYLYIPRYSSTTIKKTFYIQSAFDHTKTSTAPQLTDMNGLYNSTTAMTSLQFSTLVTYTFITGSKIWLYGI